MIKAATEASTCLDIIRDLLLTMHSNAGDPAAVRRCVAEALEQQEEASLLLSQPSHQTAMQAHWQATRPLPVDTAPRDGTEIAYLQKTYGDDPEVPVWRIGRMRWLTIEQAMQRFGGSAGDWDTGWYDDGKEDPGAEFWLPVSCLPEGVAHHA